MISQFTVMAIDFVYITNHTSSVILDQCYRRVLSDHSYLTVKAAVETTASKDHFFAAFALIW